MRLAAIEVKDYRSVFSTSAGLALRLDLGRGMNTLVGRNNCGKSNILRAVAVALDPELTVDPENDIPGPRKFAHPVVTLDIHSEGTTAEERELLDLAESYERLLNPRSATHAAEGRIRFEVSWPKSINGAIERREAVLTRGGRRPPEGEPEEIATELVKQLRELVQFVVISSGESLESVLEGKFKEILHGVIRERLATHFNAAEAARQEYITGLEDNLLSPLRSQLTSVLAKLFPEVDGVRLAPDVSGIEATLSRVAVSLTDVVETPLIRKGTGVRGGVLVAMLGYLATNATRGLVIAVEEPESFLHPGAQEDLRDALETLANQPDVTLLVTTHSPFIVSRHPDGQVIALSKDREGRTWVRETAAGDAPHAPLIGELVREATLEDLLRQATQLPAGVKAMVLVEGDGDRKGLELGAIRSGRPELLEGLRIVPCGGTTRLVLQAILTRGAAGDVPVIVVVDSDENGIDAWNRLTGSHFRFPKPRIIRLHELFPPLPGGNIFPYEAEDLLSPELIEAFKDHLDGTGVQGTKLRPDGHWHYDLTKNAKEELDGFLDAHAKPEDLTMWVDLLVLIRTRAGLPIPEPQPTKPVTTAGTRGNVLIINTPDAAGPLLDRAAVLPTDTVIPPDTTHLGFYSAAAIQPVMPRIEAVYVDLLIGQTSLASLASGNAEDVRAHAAVVGWLKTGRVSEGEVRTVLLLSPTDDVETIQLEQPIVNTKKTSTGRPVAWVVSHQAVPWAALIGPRTTSDLDALIAGDSIDV